MSLGRPPGYFKILLRIGHVDGVCCTIELGRVGAQPKESSRPQPHRFVAFESNATVIISELAYPWRVAFRVRACFLFICHFAILEQHVQHVQHVRRQQCCNHVDAVN